MPGSDVNGMVIAIGQRVGTGIMSTQTAREMDPAIEDPIRERDQVEIESLRRAMLAGLEQQASQGQLDPSIIAEIATAKAERHVTLEQALIKVHKEQQEKQAALANQQQQMAQQGGPQEATPDMQHGIGGAAAMQGIGAPIPAPQQGPANLSQMLANLRRPAGQSPAESALAPQGQ